MGFPSSFKCTKAFLCFPYSNPSLLYPSPINFSIQIIGLQSEAGLNVGGVSGKRRSPVGAGLPAKAARQSLHVLLHYRFRRQASSHIWYLLI